MKYGIVDNGLALSVRAQRMMLWLSFAAAVVGAGVALMWHLGDAPWVTDEPVYRNAAAAIYEFGNWSHNLEHPPLGKLIMGASMEAFGGEHVAWAVRLPSALATLIAGVLLAGFVRSVFGREDRWRGEIAAFATFVTWAFLPHPDLEFNVSRLGYLDALMAMFLAGALWCAWQWQSAWSWRWAIATGVVSGLALATKFPALLVLIGLIVLVVHRDDAPARRRALQFGGAAAIAGVVALLPWLPLGTDLPRALRFAAAMQNRDIQQTIEVAGTTYRDGAPFWTQLWWQWDAWPSFAIVQLIALVLAWCSLPRRVAILVWATVLVPFAAFATGGRILPHWQITWQLGMAVLVGAAFAWLFTRAHPHARVKTHIDTIDPARTMRTIPAIIFALLVAAPIGQHLDAISKLEEPSDRMRVARALEPADIAGGYVLDVADAGIERALIRALPIGWDGTYHSAAYSQHAWVGRDGARPQEPPVPKGQFVISSNTGTAVREKAVSALVLPEDTSLSQFSIPQDVLRDEFEREQIGTYDVWIRKDLRRG